MKLLIRIMLAATAIILVSPATWPSPKGKILFSAKVGDKINLFTMDDDGTNLKQLTTGNDTSPSWFPDGQRICFSRSGGNDAAIYTMDADGKNPRQITKTGYYHHPDVSPDGRKIAFVGKTWKEAQIWMMDSDGTNQVQITEFQQLGDPLGRPIYEFRGDLFWPPDGKKIIFSALVEIDNRFEAHAAWSKDGKKILYSMSDTEGNGSFNLLDIETKQTHQLAAVKGVILHISWWTEMEAQSVNPQGKLTTTWGQIKKP